jgi:hypothetical protein
MQSSLNNFQSKSLFKSCSVLNLKEFYHISIIFSLTKLCVIGLGAWVAIICDHGF